MRRFIVNGFFRSGTSILWRALAEANKETGILYEPCHPELSFNIEESKNSEEVHPIHGFRLWDAYVPFSQEVSEISSKYLRENPRVFADNASATAEYADLLFNRCAASVLQVNRWHYVLDDVCNLTSSIPVHIVRNPRSVFKSFVKIFQNNRSPVVGGVLRSVMPNYLPPTSWGVVNALREVPRPLVEGRDNITKIKSFNLFHGWDAFISLWLIVNAQAVSGVHRAGGRVFWIENIARNPSMVQNYFRENGLDMRTDLYEASKVGRKMDRDLFADYSHDAERLGLLKEYKVILQTLDLRETF